LKKTRNEWAGLAQHADAPAFDVQPAKHLFLDALHNKRAITYHKTGDYAGVIEVLIPKVVTDGP